LEAEVRLLLVVDVQKIKGPLRATSGFEGRLMIYRIHEGLYTHPHEGKPLQECSEAYSEAIAFSIAYWSGCVGDSACPEFGEDLHDASRRIEHWDGGNAAEQLFCPRRFRGQQLPSFGLAELPGLIERCQVSNLMLPEGLVPEAPFHTYAYGKSLSLALPAGSSSGHMLQICLNEGHLTAAVYSLAAGLATCIGQAVVTVW